jgi:phospholipid/cholesterol/gamma-HCH transport system substrate-binding protein
MARSRAAVVGAFVVGGILLFAIGLFLIGDRRLLFVDQYELYTRFSKVTGVQEGTSVRIAGLPAGEVTEILVPRGPEGRFRVRMRLREDLQPLVRTDSRVSIQSDGIVGNTFLQIDGGTDQAPIAAPESTIEGRDPIEFADLIAEGRDTFRLVTTQMLELRGEISGAIAVLTSVLEEADDLIETAGADVKVITASARRISGDLTEVSADARAMVADIKAGKGTVGKVLTRDDLWESATRLSANAEKTLENVQKVSADLRQSVERFRAKDGPAEQLTADLQAAVRNAREITSDLAENTEALKRNWLVHGFFKDRGYYDLDQMTLDEYRVRGVDPRDRAPLRIWIASDQLFETPDGERPRLSADGRRRLDTAMSQLLAYPRSSPLVVEGYATLPDAAARYVQADARAQEVRNYIRGRFRRSAELVGAIPIGLDAQGAPSGDGRWNGVALTLYVRKDDLGTVGGTRGGG